MRRAWLGVTIGDLEANAATQLGLRARSGVLVVETVPKGPAELAGVQENDVIVEFGGVPVRAIGDLQSAVEQQPIGSQQQIFVMREGRRIPLDVTVAALPSKPE